MLLIAVVAVLSLIVIQVLVLAGAKELIYPHLSWKDIAQKAVLAILAQFFAYIPLAIFMVVLVEGKYHVRFWPAIRWNWPRSQWKMLGLGALVLLSLNLLGHFLPMPQSTPFEEFFSRPRDAYLMSVFAISLGPLMEELFFRGFLYPVLARRMGVVLGNFFHRAALRPDPHVSVWLRVGSGAADLPDGSGLHGSTRSHRIGSIKLSGARRLQRDRNASVRDRDGRFPPHGKSRVVVAALTKRISRLGTYFTVIVSNCAPETT